MTKDEALYLALVALDIVKIHFTQNRHVNEAITAIKQARSAPVKDNSNYRLDPPGLGPAGGTQVSKVWWDGEKLMAKPIPLEDFYQPAPECTRSHPHENMDAMCELRTEIARLTNENARLKAQPAPVQEPVAWMYPDDYERMLTSETFCTVYSVEVGSATRGESSVALYTTPPAAQRQWAGLTDEERTEIRREHYARTLPLMDAVEAKLKEKNT